MSEQNIFWPPRKRNILLAIIFLLTATPLAFLVANIFIRSYLTGVILGLIFLLIRLYETKKLLAPNNEIIAGYPALKVGMFRFILYFLIPVANIIWLLALVGSVTDGLCLWLQKHNNRDNSELTTINASAFLIFSLAVVIAIAIAVRFLSAIPLTERNVMRTISAFMFFVMLYILAVLILANRYLLHLLYIHKYFLLLFIFLLPFSTIYDYQNLNYLRLMLTGYAFLVVVLSFDYSAEKAGTHNLSAGI